MIELIQLTIKNIKKNPIITIAFTIIVCTLIAMNIFLRIIYVEVTNHIPTQIEKAKRRNKRKPKRNKRTF